MSVKNYWTNTNLFLKQINIISMKMNCTNFISHQEQGALICPGINFKPITDLIYDDGLH